MRRKDTLIKMMQQKPAKKDRPADIELKNDA
jgi:hypothetical protein